MITALLNYDPMGASDIYSSEWESVIANRSFSLEEVAQLYRKKLITVDEYIYAVDYLGG